MDVPGEFSGGCACDAIRYECRAAPIAMVNCHCRDCQRASGSAFTPVVVVSADAFEVTRGKPLGYESAAASGHTGKRYFCGQCGCRLFASSSGGPEYVGINAGSLDDPSWYSPVIDIWTQSAQPWVVMSDETAKFPQSPPVPDRA